ncbi:PREDICTED: F-box protein At2g27310-like [Populus euphratica]|uniref:F-box protein At2g27310-like n=1 Tax=Populus euphratica TaxID=75702 RepID=A0AAJ6T9B6_POPEU|nr:PREDICTED: F-box protein At2g27310-like [Populus euphratica]
MVALSTPPPQQPSSTTTQDGTISTLHPDILQTHILTLLDGPTLAASACASSELYALSTEDKLWRNICTSSWPSTNDPTVSSIISTFSSGYRSFFSDSYPLLHHHHHSSSFLTTSTEYLVSAVDIYYKDVPIFSKVEKNETLTDWFRCSPFRVDLLEPKEFVQTSIQYQTGEKDSFVKQLEENMTLSWILIDPKRRRAMNLSSGRPVSVQKHWLTGEVVVKFATIMAGDGGEKEFVECGVMVCCGEKEGGEMEVREISVGMEDMEGRNLTGRESLVVLQEAMERGERRKGKCGTEGKGRYEEFVERKRERKERKQKMEKVLDMVCIVTGITIFVSSWSFILFR